jgi:intracellular sulfur oxidation DsrE/DsrF family protein
MTTDTHRRRLLKWLTATTGLGLASRGAQAAAEHQDLFGEPEHKLVYQFNRADLDYMDAILFSVGAMLRQHGDNIHMVITVIGPGIHILAKKPRRPVPELIRQRVSSLAAYGVAFHACGNTMKSLDWTKDDMLEFADIVEIGANDLMTLQEQGYSYISW